MSDSELEMTLRLIQGARTSPERRAATKWRFANIELLDTSQSLPSLISKAPLKRRRPLHIGVFIRENDVCLEQWALVPGSAPSDLPTLSIFVRSLLSFLVLGDIASVVATRDDVYVDVITGAPRAFQQVAGHTWLAGRDGDRSLQVTVQVNPTWRRDFLHPKWQEATQSPSVPPQDSPCSVSPTGGGGEDSAPSNMSLSQRPPLHPTPPARPTSSGPSTGPLSGSLPPTGFTGGGMSPLSIGGGGGHPSQHSSHHHHPQQQQQSSSPSMTASHDNDGPLSTASSFVTPNLGPAPSMLVGHQQQGGGGGGGASPPFAPLPPPAAAVIKRADPSSSDRPLVAAAEAQNGATARPPNRRSLGDERCGDDSSNHFQLKDACNAGSPLVGLSERFPTAFLDDDSDDDANHHNMGQPSNSGHHVLDEKEELLSLMIQLEATQLCGGNVTKREPREALKERIRTAVADLQRAVGGGGGSTM